jgi:hypothetical protein
VAFFGAPFAVIFLHRFIEKEMLPIRNYCKEFSVQLTFGDVLIIIEEELVWRFVPSLLFTESLMVSILLVLSATIVFVYAIHDIKGKREGFEMLLFSLLFWIWIICPGANYGLHFGRNNYIMFLRNTVGWRENAN